MARGRTSKKKVKTEHTPVMQQFLRAKEQYPDAIIFFRLGDFYEMFFDDAIRASELLDIVQSFRGTSPDGSKIPMAGVPHHAAAGYIARLLELGQTVAVCEQMADPSTVKGVVPREVVRVITPGLCLEPGALDARSHNYLVTLARAEHGIGLAAFELSTGELRACVLANEPAALAELVRLDPRELLVPEGLEGLGGIAERALDRAVVRLQVAPVESPDALIEELLGAEEAEQLAVELAPAARGALAQALAYAKASQPLGTFVPPRVGHYDPSGQLVLDEAAVRNLELVRTLSGERRGSLLHLVDQTKTAMGARLLKRRLLAPLADVAAIRRRHDAVEALVLDAPLRQDLRQILGGVADLERLTTRAVLAVATPRDLAGIRDALVAAEALRARLLERPARPADDPLASATPDEHQAEVLGMLETALVDEPPQSTKDGGYFRAGLHAELDELRELSSRSKDVILSMQQRERERTGISSLKIKFNKVFGYYLEVTKSNLHLVPADYRRKQTIANGERFVTEELDELEEKILQADEKSRRIEAEMLADLIQRVADRAPHLRLVAERLGALDVHASFAALAHRYDYVRPTVDQSTAIDLVDARHPIVERLAAAGEFVPNDLSIDSEGTRMMIITGPNMSGKSTVMRQVALAVILAQAGSFVPATSARIGIVDRVYTRVGASDNLGQGLSTFMVEMKEAAAILRGATDRSLVVLDEIGRGTSTYDGLAIAWAVAEHLHDGIGCRALFATHYHELCELPETRPGVVNFNVAAREYGDDVVFLHKLVPGGANRSYGVAVARLAGVPAIVLARARAILADLEGGAPLPSGAPARMRGLDSAGRAQLELFASVEPSKPSEVEATLRQLDVDHMTPVDALVALARLKGMLSE